MSFLFELLRIHIFFIRFVSYLLNIVLEQILLRSIVHQTLYFSLELKKKRIGKFSFFQKKDTQNVGK